MYYINFMVIRKKQSAIEKNVGNNKWFDIV